MEKQLQCVIFSPYSRLLRSSYPSVYLPLGDPSHIDSGLDHVTCFCQWDTSKYDTNRNLKSVSRMRLILSCCSWDLCTHQVQRICPGQCIEDMVHHSPYPSQQKRTASTKCRPMSEAILDQLVSRQPTSWLESHEWAQTSPAEEPPRWEQSKLLTHIIIS